MGKLLLVTTVQPKYHWKKNPDENIRGYIKNIMDKAPRNGLILFPEYSNAGGLSEPNSEQNAMFYSDELLNYASLTAKRKGSFVGINVLENKQGRIGNVTYLFNRNGEVAFKYFKQHLPPSEKKLGVSAGDGSGVCHCTCESDGIRFAFLTCYDVYFNEQIEKIALFKPDIILIPGYQRGERNDILLAQTKMIAFRCNAYVIKSSYSMGSKMYGGCSMIVAPDGKILKNIGKKTGMVSRKIDYLWKYQRSAGFGEKYIRNDDFINIGLCPDAFCDRNES